MLLIISFRLVNQWFLFLLDGFFFSKYVMLSSIFHKRIHYHFSTKKKNYLIIIRRKLIRENICKNNFKFSRAIQKILHFFKPKGVLCSSVLEKLNQTYWMSGISESISHFALHLGRADLSTEILWNQWEVGSWISSVLSCKTKNGGYVIFSMFSPLVS